MSTEYLVVHDFGSTSGISVVGPGVEFDHDTECWAIRSGEQIMFARSKIVRHLEKFHMGGAFSAMARYGLSYDEMVEVIRGEMGPSDRDRYELARLELAEMRTRSNSRYGTDLVLAGSGAVGSIVWNVTRTTLYFGWRLLRFVLVQILWMFALMAFDGKKK